MASQPLSGSDTGVRSRAAGIFGSRRPGRHPGVRYLVLIVVVLAVAAGLAGLTAGRRDGPAPVAAVVERGNAICQKYGERIAGIATPSFDPDKTSASDLPAAARYLDQVVPQMQKEMTDLRDAGRPSASRDLYLSVLSALDVVIRDETAANQAAHAGDLGGFEAAYRADAQHATHLSGVARQFGLVACAS